MPYPRPARCRSPGCRLSPSGRACTVAGGEGNGFVKRFRRAAGKRGALGEVLCAALIVVCVAAPAASASGQLLVFNGNRAFNDTYSETFFSFAQAATRTPVTTTSLPADLSPNACVLLPANSATFDAGQKATLASYLNGGGTIIAMGENGRFASGPAATQTMNDLAASLGVAVSGSPFAAVDPDYRTTTRIQASPYTDGVAKLGYAYTSLIQVSSPAKLLVSTNQGNQPFLAVQDFGTGKFVYSGDGNIFSDLIGAYSVDDNARFAKNLCGDIRPPDITIVTPPQGGRYQPDAAVNASWFCTDGDSGIDTTAFTNGPLTGTVSGLPIDTAGTAGGVTTKTFAVTCTDVAGNSATKQHQYVVDDRPPTVQIAIPGTGPYTLGSTVPASWECSDPDNDVLTRSYVNGPLSGTVTGGAIDTSSKGLKSFTVTCTDMVGNSATQTVQYTVPNSPPVASISAPASGARFKPGQAFNATWACNDPDGPADIATRAFVNMSLSGSLSGLPIDTSVPGTSLVSKTFDVTCTDVENLTGTASATYLVDPNPPIVTIVVPLDGGVYERGTVAPASWACADPDGAGDIDPNPAKTFATKPVGLPIDTGGLGLKSFTATCADLTGWSTSKTVQYTVVDTHPPAVTITIPKDGATYDQGQVVSPSYACTDPDGFDDVKSCVREGGATGPADTSRPGSQTFTVIGEDFAGNRATKSVTYTVRAKTGTPSKNAVSGSGTPAAAKVCKSRRQFRIRVKKLRGGVRAVSATVFVNGKKTTTRRGKRITATVTLKGLRKGTYNVKINVRYSNGRVLSYTRRFKTCTPKGR